MKIQNTCVIILLSVLLLSCADPVPVPPSKIDYVGLWVAIPDRYISIFANGRLEYREKLSFGMHNRTQSNFTFKGNKIESSMFVNFIIDIPPYKENGQWKMQIEGISYIRTGPPVSYGRSNNWPDGINK
jgi:hypothetical protein